jgi:hypothetical protein
MEWAISFLSDTHIVVVKTEGVASEATSLDMAKSIGKAMLQYKSVRCLIDHSAIKSVTGSIAKTYHRPEELNEIGVPRNIKVAEVTPPEHKEHFNFFETVCRNRGFDFSVFENREAAMEWLTK